MKSELSMKKPIDRVAAFDGLFVVRPAWAESEEALMKPAGVDAVIAMFFFTPREIQRIPHACR